MDFVNVTEDGGVSKKVITEGYGDTPPLHARCVVHYVGRLADDGNEFMDTKKENAAGEPAIIVAGRGKVQLSALQLFTS